MGGIACVNGQQVVNRTPDIGKALSKRPKNRNDCTVVAVAIACGVGYDTAYDALAGLGRICSKGFWFPSGIRTVKHGDILGRHFHWAPLQAVKGERRITPQRFCIDHPLGCYVLRLSGHVVTVVDGIVYDIGNPWGRCVYGFWTASIIC